jgi:hypothetical protein
MSENSLQLLKNSTHYISTASINISLAKEYILNRPLNEVWVSKLVASMNRDGVDDLFHPIMVSTTVPRCVVQEKIINSEPFKCTIVVIFFYSLVDLLSVGGSSSGCCAQETWKGRIQFDYS